MTPRSAATKLPFSIRKAFPEDVFDVHRVHTTAIREGGKDHYPREVLETWVDAFNPQSFPENLQRMDVYVAELEDNRIAGFFAFDPGSGEVESVYVAPWGRGRGMGSFFLGFAEELARQAGFQRAWLDASLNSVAFYRAFGWQEIRRHGRVRRGVEIPVVRMEKPLFPPDPHAVTP